MENTEHDKEVKMDNGKFDHERLLQLIEKTNASLPDVDPEAFNEVMLELVKLFGIIGSAIAFAFKDITTKVQTVRDNYKRFPEMQGKGLISFIEMEEKLKVQELNGDTNSKKAPEPKAAWKDYHSTSRTLYRLLWFCEFISMLIQLVESDRKAKISDCGKKAYEHALAPHHPFAVRMAAKAGLSFAPSRDKFLKDVFPDNMTEEEKYAAIKKCADGIAVTRDHIRKYYEDNKLTSLP